MFFKCVMIVVLKIIVSNALMTFFSSVDVHNVSLIPSNITLTLRIGTNIEVTCKVNSNANPAPTITWYLGSTNITDKANPTTNRTSIIINGEKDNNNKQTILIH